MNKVDLYESSIAITIATTLSQGEDYLACKTLNNNRSSYHHKMISNRMKMQKLNNLKS